MHPLTRKISQIRSYVDEKISLDTRASPYYIIAQCLPTQNQSHLFWWRTTGSALAILLDRAGNTLDSSVRGLLFYYLYIIPYLGEAPKATARRQNEPTWKSFMTDEYTPVEFSWSWADRHQPPVIPFSFEPIGPQAGTEADPLNAYSAFAFMSVLRHVLPSLDMRWFDHFSETLLSYKDVPMKSEEGPGGNSSRLLLAFDLLEDQVTPKAYFFPGFKAAETGRERIDLISDAIESLPDHHPSAFPGFSTYHEFIKKSQLEVEMLAIDCVVPADARLKLYVRNRSTCWNSVRYMVILGDSANEPGIRNGLEELEMLWTILFGLGGELAPDQEMDHKNHRTAGILYNFELRPGKNRLVPKVYIPVRHYMQSDSRIMQRLTTYLKSQHWGAMTEKYTSAMERLL